ncbi:peroxisomal leader peptide-processing protease-like isoform X2 [Lytechinus variegatus]|uniref:peroxisomal leader peptide-processing protease-like isoform X2 n=1 Tax=Lytechinus variegatus TaxID=7654 RepID=UPI001BB2B3E1|nr:peroxisomal leader peptide-processing protease-like isoform X2 [Lytechinus variegatus]
MKFSEKEDFPVCLVTCKSNEQPLSSEKRYQSSQTSTSSSASHKNDGKLASSLQDFSSQVGASGIVIDHQNGLVITTALPFTEYIPTEHGGVNDHLTNNELDDSVDHYSSNEFKNLSVSVIFQSRVKKEKEEGCGLQSSLHRATTPHRPSANKVFSALHQPTDIATSHVDDEASDSFEVYDARVLLLWKCKSFHDEVQTLMPVADGWELDYGDKRGEIGSSSHLDSSKDVVVDGEAETRKDNFLSWFALIQLKGDSQMSAQAPIKIIPSTGLHLAQPVVACGTPFATLSPSIFYNSLSRGIITKHCGKDLVMTDARCMPGMEGGGLFVWNNKQRYLAAMIVSPLCWKANEWIGLTLACSMTAILDSLQGMTSIDLSRVRSTNFGNSSHHSHRSNTETCPKHFQSVVLLRVGTVWGSGVVIDMNEGLILTCRHVVKSSAQNQVSVKVASGPWMKASVLHTNPATSPIDLAIVQVKGQLDTASSVRIRMGSTYQEGSQVYAVGFPLFDPSLSSTPSVTTGVVSKVITINQQPIMIQSSCAVHAGASGGALLCAKTGNLVGIIASNSRDSESGASFPHVNFSIPVDCFRHAIQQYISTKDSSWFKELEMTDERIKSAWALEETGTYTKRFPSKL